MDEYNTKIEKELKEKPKKKIPKIVQSACYGLVIGAIAGGMVLGAFAYGSGKASNIDTTEAKLTTASNTSVSSGGHSISDIAKKCTSSVVALTTKSVSETQDLFGQSYSSTSTGAGSGVIISKNNSELLIATNYHVIQGSSSITVCFNDSKKAVYKASVKGTDAANDLAVVAVKLKDISASILKSVTIASIGDSTKTEVGDGVVAIGNALGSGQSITSGVVSALNRKVTTGKSSNNASGSSERTTQTLLQTDAAINPGNSGGALFNMKGELIGINTAKYSDTSVEGMGFAIPMSKASSILKKLMNRTSRTTLTKGYGYLGVNGSDVDSSTSNTYNIPAGVYVSEVMSGQAADRAGMKQGDIITKFADQSVSSLSELKSILQTYKAGEKVNVTIYRSNNGSYKSQVLSVTLGKASGTYSGLGSSGNENQDSSQDSGPFFRNDSESGIYGG